MNDYQDYAVIKQNKSVNTITNLNQPTHSIMRKFALFLILMVGVGFIACEQPGSDVDANDPIYPSPEAVIVDDDACGGNCIALLFDGSAAVKAGAESFTSTLTPEGEGEPLSITKEAGQADACNHTYYDLPSGVYAISVYATYPEGITSEPVFLKDSKGGIVKIKLNGSSLAVKFAYATSSTLAFTWSATGFKNAATDIATAYSFGIYKDAQCKELVVSWENADSSIWDGCADGYPQFEFSGLESNKPYWFVVKDLDNNAVSMPLKAETLDFTVVVPSADAKVEVGGIAVAEDFSELVWGANLMRGSAAYSANDRNLATAFDKAEGENPVGGGEWGWYLAKPSTEIVLYSTLKGAVENSRLAQWGICNEVAGSQNPPICSRTGFLKLGGESYTALMCTPALTNLKETATLELSFDQARYESDPTTAAVFVLNESQHGGKEGGYAVTPTYDNLIPTVEFEIKPGRTFTTEKIVLQNVAPGARIGIGPIRKDGTTPGSAQHRMYLDNVVVKVVEYGASKVLLAKPALTSAVATAEEIVVKWDKVEKATGYVLEYKEAGAESYTAIELDYNVFEYTISGLKDATTYNLRLKAVESVSNSESEYSDVREIHTIVKAEFPMVATTADEFISIISNAGALLTAVATDEIQIAGNLDFAGKTLPEGVVFPGTLNGQNFKLSNITSDHALFASIVNVKDLTIDETCSFASDKACSLAALAVEATGTLSNVVNKASVSINMTTDADATVLISGLVAFNSAKLEGCKNYGDVTYVNTASSLGVLISGLAAYSEGAVSNCENNGKVTMSIPYLSGFGIVKTFTNVPAHIGGLVAHLGENAPITNSTNNGEIDYDITHIEKLGVSCGTNRPRMGGVVGMAYSDVTSCTNNGKMDICVTTSDQSIYTSKNYPLNVGGVSGGAFSDATGASCSNVTDCVNNGPINYVTYCKGTRPTCGGVVGYPGYENAAQTNLITRCVNNGKMVIKAFDYARIGGINGGAGNVTYCKNYGAIEGYIQQVDGLIGGISGFHSNGNKFEYNESYGALSNDLGSYTGGTAELGGLIGQHGNYASYDGEGRGCIVNCDITYGWSNVKWFGLTIGWYDGSKTVVLGTEDEPIKVLGGSMTYSGGTIEITAENYETYLKGSGSKAYTVHAKFGE